MIKDYVAEDRKAAMQVAYAIQAGLTARGFEQHMDGDYAWVRGEERVRVLVNDEGALHCEVTFPGHPDQPRGFNVERRDDKAAETVLEQLDRALRPGTAFGEHQVAVNEAAPGLRYEVQLGIAAYLNALTERHDGTKYPAQRREFKLMPNPRGKYLRITCQDFYLGEPGQMFVTAFVDALGNIYKAAGWTGPAKGVRFNVATPEGTEALVEAVRNEVVAGACLYR